MTLHVHSQEINTLCHHEYVKLTFHNAGRLGGHAAVEAAVDIFYKKLLADEQVSHFFNGISIARLKEKQVRIQGIQPLARLWPWAQSCMCCA